MNRLGLSLSISLVLLHIIDNIEKFSFLIGPTLDEGPKFSEILPVLVSQVES